MANNLAPTVNDVDCDDPILDLSNFFEEAARFCVLDYVGTSLEMSIQHMVPRPANYDDSIVADLPTFLEMATCEDPVDDLAIFFERAYRWACSKRLVGPDGTFYLFAELPCEIRLMIWKECIPSQIHLVAERIHDGLVPYQLQANHHIVESFERSYESSGTWDDLRTKIYDGVMDALQGEQFNEFDRAYPYHSRYCTPAYPMSFRQKTPVIAKVNQEARVLALERVSKRYNLAFVHRDLSKWMERIEESPVWLKAKNDTVLINTQYINTQYTCITATRHRTDAVLVPHKEDRLFGMITRNMIQVAIFAAALIDSGTPPLYHAFSNANRVNVVVGVFRFDRMSDSEAAITEMFGIFGEESMALVPVDDSRALLKLFKAHAAFGPQCVAEFFDWYQAQHMEQFYIPDKYLKDTSTYRSPSEVDLNWDRSRLPSDFREYCEEMRGFASSIMTACRTELMSPHFFGANEEEMKWKMKMEATFEDTFEPVFLAHRCRNPVLINFRGQ